ncbi:hypothetical protein F8388_005840 [Cannabis sativa]|uniref:CCHC-type domain-containing protein n=1 Tax=Cannabis sativa TaxID=3483 RepID=A0A7J6HFY6_CANSA|nr:hypothetical protein F8388_005840 [Cannabis sativa]KAF4404549.1 hypothetical protein G4B88_005935 [Cannabis sativa]
MARGWAAQANQVERPTESKERASPTLRLVRDWDVIVFMTMDEVVGDIGGKQGRCLSLNEVSISLAPSVVTTKVLSKICLFGKILSSKTFIAKDVEKACSSIWKTQVKVEPTDGLLYGSNTFPFMFENGDMLVLLSWSSGFGVKVLAFNSIHFWVQIHSLPHDYFSRVNANLLGTLTGKVVSIELDESKPLTWKRWIQVQVEVDVSKPLCCGCFFKLSNEVNQWIQLKYEELGNFCYMCGLLGHQRRDCNLTSLVMVLNDKGSPFPLFRPWMNTHSFYANCFFGKSGTSPAMNEGNKIVAIRDGLKPVGVPSRGRGGTHVLRAWQPRSSAVTEGVGAYLGVVSLSPHLELEKPSAPLSITKDNLNGNGGGEYMGIRMSEGLNCVVNAWALTGAVGQLDGVCSGPNYGNKKSKDYGPFFKNCEIPSGPRIDLTNINTQIFSENKNDMGGSGPNDINIGDKNSVINSDGEGDSKLSIIGQDHSDHIDEKRSLSKFFQAQEGYLQELAAFASQGPIKRKAGHCDIGVPPSLETNERTTSVKKRRLDVDNHSLKIVPKWTMRRVKSVVRDFPRGVGPSSINPVVSGKHDGFGESNEPSMDDESTSVSTNNLSARCS